MIATSRPEFIPACVAIEVNPKDERYCKYIGKTIIVPMVNRPVTVIADECVDPAFGTGVVMICTYGDKEDVETVLKNKLRGTITLLTENGQHHRKRRQIRRLIHKSGTPPPVVEKI